MRIDVIGAGITGLWQAFTLARHGHDVCLYERNFDPAGLDPTSLSSAAASWFAGGMLAPFCEEEAAEPIVRKLGLHGIELWRRNFPGVIGNGSLVVALRRDRAELDRFERLTTAHRRLDEAEIAALEPALGGRFARGLFFADEAHLAPREALEFLRREAVRMGVAIRSGSPADDGVPGFPDAPDDRGQDDRGQIDQRWKPDAGSGSSAAAVAPREMPPATIPALGTSRPGRLTGNQERAASMPNSGSGRALTGRQDSNSAPSRKPTARCSADWTIDCRGMGAADELCDAFLGRQADGQFGGQSDGQSGGHSGRLTGGKSGNLRGVRGEMAVLRSDEIELSRPVRLLHPRFPLYVVPWGEGRFMVGATVLERSDAGPVTVRGALDLLGTAYALHPAFGEAEILELSAGVRPAFSDNIPKVVVGQGRLYVNGMYRHGYLTAPVFAEIVAGIVEAQGDLDLAVAAGPWESVVEDRREWRAAGNASAHAG